MQKLIVSVSIIVCSVIVSEIPAQQITMPVYESLVSQFDQPKLDQKWTVISVETDGATDNESQPKYAVGDLVRLSADANIGLPMITGGLFIPERAAGSTWMKKIEQHSSPKQIDIVVELKNVVAHYRDHVIPQEKQLEYLNGELKVLNGIYRIEQNRFGEHELIWCFSKYGVDRPDDFVVPSGSGRTLVKLKQTYHHRSDHWANPRVSNDFQDVAN